MPVQSPIHSFVDFENRLSNVVLPAYQAQFAFQFLFSSDMDIARASTLHIGAMVPGSLSTLFMTADIVDVCYWGKIAGLDFDADLPFIVEDYQIIPAGEYSTVQQLLDALAAVGFNTSDDVVFLQCCTENIQDYTIATDKGDITITFYRGLVYADLTPYATDNESNFELSGIKVGDCYQLTVHISDNIAFSNRFQRTRNTNYLTFLSYYNNEDAYDFHYPADYLVNKLWLPLYVRNPVYNEERKIYRKSNKTYKVQFATIEKQWDVVTDWFCDKLHDRLSVALAHDHIHFYATANQRQFAIDEDVFKKDEYAIEWQAEYVPGSEITAPAKFKILQVFAGRNSNCERRPVCMALPEPPVPPGCVDVSIEEAGLPDVYAGDAYDETIALTGTAPFELADIVKPAWLTIEIDGSNVHLYGTPTEEDVAEDVEISFTVTNCESGNDAFSDSIEVKGGTYWTEPLTTEGDDEYYQETIQIKGPPGANVQITVDAYTNPYSGTIMIDASVVTAIGNTFNYTLDGSGLSPVITLRLEEGTDPGIPYGMLCEWTITSVDIGPIGTPASRQISKAFTP